MSEHKEPIPSMIYNASVGGHVTNSQQIIDENENKEQSQINAEVKETLGEGGSINSRINKVKTEIIGSASSNGNTLKKIEDRISPLESKVGSGDNIDSRISAAKSEIKGTATSACDTLGKAETKINANTTAISNEVTARINAVSAETSRAQEVEQLLKEQYNGLTQSDIIIGTLPSSGTKNKIYRVPGTSSYSDYIWNGESFVKMATYNNAIDKIISNWSENLVSNNAIAEAIDGIIGREKNYVEGVRYGYNISWEQSDENAFLEREYIPCKYNDTIKWVWSNAPYEYIYLKYYDSDKNIIGQKSSAESGTSEMTVSYSNCAYIRASFLIAQKSIACIYINGKLAWKPLEKLESKTETVINNVIKGIDEEPLYRSNNIVKSGGVYDHLYGGGINYISGYYYDASTQTEYPGQNYICVRKYFEVSAGDVIEWHHGGSGNCSILVYNSNLECISFWSTANSTADGTRRIILEDGSKYIRASFIKSCTDAYLKRNNDFIWQRNKSIDSVIEDGICEQFKKDIRDGGNVSPLILLHFSDIHGSSYNLNRIADYYLAHQDLINDVIHTGDNVQSKYNDDFSFWKKLGVDNFLNTIGNHDAWEPDSYFAHAGLDAYNKFIAPYVSEWGVTQPTDAANGKNYYYKDYSNMKVRLIVLDDITVLNNADADQLAWFENVLSDAQTNNLHVIVASHYPNSITPIECSFNTIGKGTSEGYGDGNYRKDLLNQKVDAFISNGGIFVTWLVGHTHYDLFGTISGVTNKQLQIAVSTANGINQAIFDDIVRVRDKKSADLFNLIRVDTINRIISVYRIGSNFDCYGRHIETISYDYRNHKIIGCY